MALISAEHSSVPSKYTQSKMAFKFVVLAACLALAQAGGPAAYDIATASADHSSISYSQESTQKGYAGQNVVSTYSRSEDSPHSSVRVSNSHVSNDALIEHHAVGYAAPVVAKTYAAPAPILAKTAYAAPALTYAAHATPVLAKATYAAPAYAAHPAPVYAKAAYAAPAFSYAAPSLSYAAHATPILAKTYAAPLATSVVTKAYAAPVVAKTTYAAAPLVTKTTYAAPAYGYAAGYSTGLSSVVAAKTAYAAHATPVIAKTYAAAPVIAKAAYAAPAYGYAAHAEPAYGYAAHAAPAYGYAAHAAPAYGYAAHAAAPLVAKTYAAPYAYEAPVVHTSFSGLGTSYSW